MPIERNDPESRQNSSPKLRLDAKLDVTSAALPQDSVKRLVDDWIVPALVEKFVRSRMDLPVSPNLDHNEGRL